MTGHDGVLEPGPEDWTWADPGARWSVEHIGHGDGSRGARWLGVPATRP